MEIGGRSGYEYFEDEDNYLYTIAQFYPRMVVYSDNEGWQNKQFLGNGEFTLNFGDYHVELTVPADHIVASTGTLSNPKSVLTPAQRRRYEQAKKSYDQPVVIVTEEEARENEATKGGGREDVDLRCQECPRLRLGVEPQVHLGCDGGEGGQQDAFGHELLPQGGQPVVGAIQHQGCGPNPQDLQQAHHRLPLSGGHFGQRQEHRHGVPHDLLQLRSM